MGGWTVEDARDAEQRERLLEEERSFVAYCPRALDELAQAAIKFSVALWIQCSADGRTRRRSSARPAASSSPSLS